jgi:hypothetical protein
VGRDHAEVAAGALLEGGKTGFQVADLGGELLIPLGQLIILGSLRCHRPLQAVQLAHTILGEPNPVLEEKDGESQAHGEPLHGPDSVSENCTLRQGSSIVTRSRAAAVDGKVVWMISNFDRESVAAGVAHFAQLGLDTQELVVLGHAVGTGQRAGFDLGSGRRDGDIRNRIVFRLAGAM